MLTYGYQFFESTQAGRASNQMPLNLKKVLIGRDAEIRTRAKCSQSIRATITPHPG